MIRRAAGFAAALVIQATNAAAQDQLSSAQASFVFNGAQIDIAGASQNAAKYAALFSTLTPSCDPHCIAPVGVEPDLPAFLKNRVGKNTGLLVDARMPQGRGMGYIPDSVSLPYEAVSQHSGYRAEILKALGARSFEDVFNFAVPLELIVHDGGTSQKDASALIAHQLEVGYPLKKSPLLPGWHAGVVRIGPHNSGIES